MKQVYALMFLIPFFGHACDEGDSQPIIQPESVAQKLTPRSEHQKLVDELHAKQLISDDLHVEACDVIRNAPIEQLGELFTCIEACKNR